MNFLTFDIEEWFLSVNNKSNPPGQWQSFENRVEQNTEKILQMLDSKGVKATFFILGWVAESYPGLVKKISRHGHEIGYHTYYHQYLSEFSPEAFIKDIERGNKILEEVTGKKTRVFRAPFFSLTNETAWVYDILIEKGFKASSSVKSLIKIGNIVVPNRPVVVRREAGSIVEFPLNRLNWQLVKPVFTGSGYFRVLPFDITRKLIARKSYNMIYFHPRDFDKQLPYSSRLSPVRNFKNHIGSKSGLSKLDKLLDFSDFTTFDAAIPFVHENQHNFTGSQVMDSTPGRKPYSNQ